MNFKKSMATVLFFLAATPASACGLNPLLYNAANSESIRDFKLALRKNILRSNSSTISGDTLNDPENNDKAEDIVDSMQVINLEEMDTRKLYSSTLEEMPWSDHYWPIFQGVIANRYADPMWNASDDWKINSDYLSSHIADALEGDLDVRSPAEKYDILVGDGNFTLTKLMIAEGKPYFDRYGKVETWMGICHGWAPASYMSPRPANAVKALAADGKTWITFYPSDIKALTTLLWANGQKAVKFVGGRCNEKLPKEDPNGRPIDPSCLDSNPATWHLTIVNQIALNRRSFVMDTNYDAEVWNQPVVAFKYSLFNPKTGKFTTSFQEARVSVLDFERDKFQHSRSPQAKYVVGVSMSIIYVAEVLPDQHVGDNSGYDSHRTVHYTYDLELDRSGNIVGGEWHDKNHPDFLWTAVQGAKAKSNGDRYLDLGGNKDVWTSPTTALPKSWLAQIRNASPLGQPLERIVSQLTRFAN